MNNFKIQFETASSAANFLQNRLGHRRLCITKSYVGFDGVEHYYGILDWDHRVLAEWNEKTFHWDLRQDAWTVVPDSRDSLPEDVLTEDLSEERIFQLSTVENFL